MHAIDLDAYRSRSQVLDPSSLPVTPLVPQLSLETVRVLAYMQHVESYTLLYLRSLLSTRAVHDPEIASFFASWLYEETAHGLALARLLAANGTPVAPREAQRVSLHERLTSAGAWLVSRCRSDFVAVHMLWGAINELTTLTGYRRLARLSGHPVLDDLIARLIRDESRHFGFYFEQARKRLAAPATQRLARTLVERFWAPVGSGVEPESEVRFLAAHLFSGSEGRAAAQKVDETIRALPGLAGLRLVEHWLERELAPRTRTRSTAGGSSHLCEAAQAPVRAG